MRASLFVTCVVDLFEPDVGVAAVKVLRAAGVEVSCPSGQTCCGQPAWNSGFAEDAARVARTTLEALEADDADVVIVPAGSCTTMVRVFWPELFEVVGERVQVSMNLLEPDVVGPAEAYDAVAALTPVAGAELVGLVPAAVLARVPPDRWPQLDLDADRTFEARLRRSLGPAFGDPRTRFARAIGHAREPGPHSGPAEATGHVRASAIN